VIKKTNFNRTNFNRYLTGPILCAAGVLLLLFLWPNATTLAPLFPLLAASGFISGLRANMVSALFISIAIHQSSPDPSRTVVAILSAFGLAFVVGVMHRQRRDAAVEAERNRHAMTLVDAANGNLDALAEIHQDSQNLVSGWRALDDAARLRLADKIRGGLADVLLIFGGWHQLFKEKEALKWESLSQKLKEERR
jgi:hypothetical protein